MSAVPTAWLVSHSHTPCLSLFSGFFLSVWDGREEGGVLRTVVHIDRLVLGHLLIFNVLRSLTVTNWLHKLVLSIYSFNFLSTMISFF